MVSNEFFDGLVFFVTYSASLEYKDGAIFLGIRLCTYPALVHALCHFVAYALNRCQPYLDSLGTTISVNSSEEIKKIKSFQK